MNKQEKINLLIEWINEGNTGLKQIIKNRVKLIQIDADDKILALNNQQYHTELETLNWCYGKLRALLGYMVHDEKYKNLFPSSEDKTVYYMM